MLQASATATAAATWAPRPRRGGLAVALAGHALLALALWQLAPRLEPPTPLQVLQVALVDAPRAPQPRGVELPLPRPRPDWTAHSLPVPAVEVDAPRVASVQPAPAPAAPPSPPPSPEPAPRPVVAAAAPPPPPPPATPAPAAPREWPASTIAYLVPPPVELPLASRRLGEQGTVWLRVWVGADGVPRQVQLMRSSGFARLDEQAQSAMRRARFRPQLDHGVAVEWIVVAPLQYEIT
ncbi:MAG: energy transducer TonB [Rubrivivax sp.]